MKVDTVLCFLEIMKSAKKLRRKQANENDCEIIPVTWKPYGDTYVTAITKKPTTTNIGSFRGL